MILYTRLELCKLRNEYEVMFSENTNLKKENAEYLACMNGLAGTIADLNIKIKTLDEEKATLEASVRLLNEDQRQLILKNINLGNDQKCEQSLVDSSKFSEILNSNTTLNKYFPSIESKLLLSIKVSRASHI